MREYYIDGDKHLSEQAALTGAQLLQRTRFPVRGKVLVQKTDDAEVKIAPQSVVFLPEKPAYFLTIPGVV